MKHFSTKSYGHELGLSVCFRQHRATHSHCSLMHGYALAVSLTFGCERLDANNWCMDFGGLKPVKKMLVDTFDHKLIVAADDPMLSTFEQLSTMGLADVVTLPRVGCEAFAEHIFKWINEWLAKTQPSDRVWIESVEVKEHGANSAIYKRA